MCRGYRLYYFQIPTSQNTQLDVAGEYSCLETLLNCLKLAKNRYKLKDKQGIIITNKKQILNITQHFYTDLYKATTSNTINTQGTETKEEALLNA